MNTLPAGSSPADGGLGEDPSLELAEVLGDDTPVVDVAVAALVALVEEHPNPKKPPTNSAMNSTQAERTRLTAVLASCWLRLLIFCLRSLRPLR